MSEKKVTPKRSVLILAGQVILAATLLTFLVHKINIDAIWSVFRQSFGPMFLVLVCAAVLIKFLSAVQMRISLYSQGITVNIFRLFQICMITSFYAFVLPSDIAAGGITWLKLGRESKEWTKAGVAIVYLRLVNSAILFSVGFLGILLDSHFFKAEIWPPLVMLIILLCLSLLPFSSKRASLFFGRLLSRVSSRIPDWFGQRRISKNICAALGAFPSLSREKITEVAVTALLINGTSIMLLYLAAKMLSLQLPFSVMLWLLPVTMLIGLLPFAFGGLGIREGMFVVLLNPYAVTGAQKVAYSLLIFTVTIVTAIVFGGLFEFKDSFLSRKRLASDKPIPPRLLGGR